LSGNQIIIFIKLDKLEIIAPAPQRKNIPSYHEDTEQLIMGTILRRPCTLDDLIRISGMNVNEINKYLDVLESENKIEAVRQERGVFYQKKNK